METGNMMDYEAFKESLIRGLEETYGGKAEIIPQETLRTNGERYEGLVTAFGEREENMPVIRLDEAYGDYREGRADLGECVERVARLREEYECQGHMAAFAKAIRSWEYGKRNVYPLLLSTGENRELLEGLAHTPVPGLDLSVAYLVREEGERSEAAVKVSRDLLKLYGIGQEELHRQAMENLKGDGYAFRSLGSLLAEMMKKTGLDAAVDLDVKLEGMEMYVLTNRTGRYGAAGILDKETVRKFAGGRSYHILPSSLHETIFIPAERGRKEELDRMVREINEGQVEKEEWLSCHSYFYDGERDEIRMTE